MKKAYLLSSLVVVAVILTLNACKKKKTVDNETQSVVDNAICEQQFMSIQPTVNSKGIGSAGIKKINTCEIWTVLGAMGSANPNPSQDTLPDPTDPTKYKNGPVTFELDYGTTGCIGTDGAVRTGKLLITTLKRWSQLNNQVSVNLINYKVNGITYSGQVNITKVDSVTINTQVINGHCTNGSWNIAWACNKTLKQSAGYSTKTDDSDDEFQITGTSTGTSRAGLGFNTNITNPITKKTNCPFISSGTVDVTPDGLHTRTVDFGPGTCDNDATFTVDGQTIAFKLN